MIHPYLRDPTVCGKNLIFFVLKQIAPGKGGPLSIIDLRLLRFLAAYLFYQKKILLTTSMMWCNDTPKITVKGKEEFWAGLTPAS